MRTELRAAQSSPTTEIGRELKALLDEKLIHYLSFFVIDPVTVDGEECPALVALEISCDGSASRMRRRLAKAKAFLRTLFEGCAGLEKGADESGLVRFLEKSDVGADALFIAFPGHTVRQIETERELRREACALFEETAVITSAPGTACPMHAPGTERPRLSPTSAAAAFRRLKQRFDDDERVRQRPPRPFLVRWSPNGTGLRDRLDLWGKRLGMVLFVALAITGAVQIAKAGAWALAICGLVQLLYVAAVAVLWWRGSPRSLSARGRWLILRKASYSLLWASASAAAVLGVVALLISALYAMPLASALLTGAAFVTFYAAAARAGVSSAALAFGALLLLLGMLLPGWISTSLLLCFVLALLGLLTSLIAAAFFYVMDGRIAALLGGLFVLGLIAGLIDFARRVLIAGNADWVIGAGLFAALLLTVVLSVVRLVTWANAIRRLEIEEQPGPIAWPVEHLDRVQAMEDHSLQNHLATVSVIKQDQHELRLSTLRRVLRTVHLLAKVYANQGELGGIRTIHFGRFLILPDNKRLLFLGNYDGGFGSYLQEFNRVVGVTAVWSNCVGFPRSFFLLGAGAYDEQRFKAFARRSQVPTLGWYSAYPDLAIRDIEVASWTRQDLGRRLEDGASWWGRLQARFGEPLSEADCDVALRRL